MLALKEGHKSFLLLVHLKLVVRLDLFIIVLAFLFFLVLLSWNRFVPLALFRIRVSKPRNLCLAFKVQFFDKKVLDKCCGTWSVVHAVNCD